MRPPEQIALLVFDYDIVAGKISVNRPLSSLLLPSGVEAAEGVTRDRIVGPAQPVPLDGLVLAGHSWFMALRLGVRNGFHLASVLPFN